MGGASMWLSTKYGILGQHAAAAQTAASAAMQQAQNEAGMVAARNTLLGSQATEGLQRGKLYGAEAGKTGVEAAWLPKNYAAENAYRNAMARSTNMGASISGNDAATGRFGGEATGNMWVIDPNTGLSTLNPNPRGSKGGFGMPAPNANPVAPLPYSSDISSLLAPPASSFAHTNDWQQYQQQNPPIAAPSFAGGTSDVQPVNPAPAAAPPNYGAWGAPVQTPQPNFGSPALGMGMPLIPVTKPQNPQERAGLSATDQAQGTSAGTHFAGAGYQDGVPVPTGGTAYSTKGMEDGPGGSSGRLADPWGLTIPMGHSRVTGAEGSWDELPSTPVTTSIDGQRPQRLSKPGAMGGYNKHPYVNGGDTYTDYGAHTNDWQYAKGTSKVPPKGEEGKGKSAPAKGGGKTPGKGMVEAGLAPGEAVLTPGAAEHMGRDNIGLLNALSHHGMLPSQGAHLGGQPHTAMPQSIGSIPGLPPPAMAGGGAGGPPGAGRAPMGKPGFAKGSANVSAPDSIGAPMRLQQSSLGGKPTPDLRLAKGTSKVPGKPTNPSKDTQHGQIPVGGAVLTNDAANHVGRGLIAHLNTLHSGMPQPGYAEGTASVPETNGQHLMNQLGSAWDYMTTPNQNADLAVGARGLAAGYEGIKNRLAPGVDYIRNGMSR